MNLHFTWNKFRDLALLVIGVALVILMIQVRQQQVRDGYKGLDGRVATCRILEALDQRFVPSAPCDKPEVQTELKKLPVTLVGTAQDHHLTQSLVCQLAYNLEVSVPPECKKVLGNG